MDEVESVAVGDRLWLVLLAYFLVFLPWTVFQALDFIGPEWKTVNDTRRDGWTQFVVTLIPVSAISYYIYSQARAGDYKEMSAAIVALFFAASHLATTWWGLWQLAEFRRWAVSAIRILESQGTEYKLLRDYQEPPEGGVSNLARWKAGQIKVNETVVDNRIFGGKTRCYAVRSNGNKWMQLRDRRSRRCYSKLLIIAQSTVVILCSWVTNVLYFATRACKLRMKHTEHSLWKLRPHEPVDVWINWAVAFAAQGLDKWIEQFDVAGAPRPADGRTSDGYEDRQSCFAREVLTSAVLLMPDRHFPLDKPNVIFGEGHPLRWGGQDAAETHFGKKGKVDKMDMLRQAIASGRNLPFNAPQAMETVTGNITIETVTADLKKSGYKSYEYDLKQAVGDMPSKFGNTIDKLTIDMLEWLTIKLSIGVWEASASSDTETSSESESSESSAIASSDTENRSESELIEGSGPIIVLRRQLGFGDNENKLVSEGGNGFASLSFPLKQVGLGCVLSGNRAVLKVSASIDNWVAFNAGDCLTKVLEYDPEWREACLAMPRGQAIDNNENSSLLRRRSEIEEQLPGYRYLVYANDVLERLRFTSQYGMGEITDLHLDQTISFVGVVMESVRSTLATGLSTGGRTVGFEGWTPKIDFSEGSELLTSPSLEFELSESVACALRSCETKNSFDEHGLAMTRPIEMRLLCELQGKCEDAIGEQTTPSNVTAMIGCMLGFPALRFTSKVSNIRPVRASQLNPSSTDIDFTEREWEASITPVCAPQELHVALSIVCSEETRADVSVRLARKSKARDDLFDWESWRDAFNGRLRGLRKWQEHQRLNVVEECVTYCDITQGIERWSLSDPRTGSQLQVWAGWLPHRPSICKYEVSTDDLILKYATKTTYFKEEGKPIPYDDACQEDLGYTLGAVAERLFEVQRRRLPTDADGGSTSENLPTVVNLSADQLVGQGKDLLNQEKRDLRGALQRFELAARKDNVDGLQYAVKILIDEKSGQANLGKAVFLTEQFGWMHGSRNSSVHVRASVIEEIYLKLLEYSKYESSVVLGLARFEVQRMERMELNGSLNTCDVMNILGRSFRQTGQIELVREMVVLSAHCAWLRTKNNPLGTVELFPVGSWGSWILSTSSNRAQLQEDHFGKKTRDRRLLEIFLYAAGKSMKDWRWLEDIVTREDIRYLMGADALDEISRRQDEHAPERNECIINLLRGGDEEKTALLGDIYERGIVGVDADLTQAVEAYGDGAMNYDDFSTERLGTIARGTEEEVGAIRPRILELLNDAAAKGGNVAAALVLGDMYQNGFGGVEVNLSLAVHMFGIVLRNPFWEYRKIAELATADLLENGLAGIEVKMHEVRWQIYRNDVTLPKRLGEIARLEGVQSQEVRSDVLEILKEAVEDGIGKAAASVLGGLYESGLEGLTSDLERAVDLYRIGVNNGDTASADRLANIASRDDDQARTLRPRILRMLYDALIANDALIENANQDAAATIGAALGALCERGVDIWTSCESHFMQLISQSSTNDAVVSLLAKIAKSENATAFQVRPRILEALKAAVDFGKSEEAATALGNIYERDDISRAVETFGTAGLQGHQSSISRLGKIALRTEGPVKMRVMELLREAADLEHVHAVAVQAAVLEHDAKNENGDMSRAIALFTQAGVGGHNGSMARLRNIAVRRREDEAWNGAFDKLLDVAWREICSTSVFSSDTIALAAVSDILGYVLSLNTANVDAALTLFEYGFSRIYGHQYPPYYQLKIPFSAARGLVSIVRNPGMSVMVRQRAGSLLGEYVKLGKESPMEFFTANLVNGSNASDETMLQAIHLYKKLMKMETPSSPERSLKHEQKAEMIGENEISAMKSVVSVLETSIADAHGELAGQLRSRYESLEEKMEEHHKHLNKIAEVLYY